MTDTGETKVLERNGGTLACHVVPWDTAAFGFPVAEISRFELGAHGAEAGLLADFEAWCADRRIHLVSCRLDHLRLPESMALEMLGFRFVEMVLTPRLDTLDDIDPPRHQIEIEDATPLDLPEIEAIAATAFTTGRFLLDPRLDPALSHGRYASWVRTSLDDPRQTLSAARLDGRLVGFFIVEVHPDQSVYWHLTAVAPDWQGRGVGRSLWRTMLLRHRAAGATSVRTTISVHNPAVMNLYARLGFRFDSPRMTFHWLREPIG